MKKKDLKSKMFVKLRNGDLYLVVEDVIVKEDDFMILEIYSENLLCNYRDDKHVDIVEVFKIYNPYFNFKDDLGMMSLNFKKIELNDYFVSLWKREEVLKEDVSNDEQIV
jgi:hypothetical protein